jgi:hypothetical protein
LQHEYFERPVELPGNEGFRQLDNYFVPLGVAIFPTELISMRLGATYVHQRGFLQAGAFFDRIDFDDSFCVADASFTYRLPYRRGFVSVGATNMLNEDIHFQETDPLNPRFAPGRLAYARLRLEFQ